MSIHKTYKVYGFFEDKKHLILEKIKNILQTFNIHEIEENQPNRIDFFYWENTYFDLDSFIQKIESILSPTTFGQIDFIDFWEWNMKRIQVEDKQIKVKDIPLQRSQNPYTL
ncbi:MAG: hypothetical protein Q9M37_01495 [Desulfonauticus sp.]|nr:hypothetical protein [Desulfonauticus sp.]